MITKNQLKYYFWKKITGHDTKKTKRLTGIQVLTKKNIFLYPAKSDISLYDKESNAVSYINHLLRVS